METSRKNLEIGSRAYLIKLGAEPKGIIASGKVVSTPVKLEGADRLHLVDLEMDIFLDFNREAHAVASVVLNYGLIVVHEYHFESKGPGL